MAHYAEIVDGVVARVIVVSNDEQDGEAFCNNLLGGTWKQTSYNTFEGKHKKGKTPLRKNYAGVGYTYDEAKDAFIAPKPFASWIIDDEKGTYEAPTKAGVDDLGPWDEDTKKWLKTKKKLNI